MESILYQTLSTRSELSRAPTFTSSGVSLKWPLSRKRQYEGYSKNNHNLVLLVPN